VQEPRSSPRPVEDLNGGHPEASRERARPFKPQTVLLRRVPSVGSNDIWRSQTESGTHGFAVSWQLEEKAELEGQTVFQLLLLCLISTMGWDNVRMNTYCDVDYAASHSRASR
jgi:hypothetical protein